MAATTTASTKELQLDGDINTGRGQFGQVVYTAPAGDIVQMPMTDFDRFYNKYVLAPTLNINFTLATIGLTNTEVQPGYEMYILNNSTFTINLIGFSAKLRPMEVIHLAAKSVGVWQKLSELPSANSIVVGSAAPIADPTDVAGDMFIDSSTGGLYTYSGGVWSAISGGGGVSTFSAGTTGLTPAAPTAGVVTLAGTVNPTHGGTGLTAYTTGDMIYASAANVLSALPAVATGNSLISGGVATAPSWGKIGLTTHVSGVLPTANGGTNANLTAVNGGSVYSTATGLAITAAGTSGQVLTSNGAAAPTWQTPASGGVTTFSAGTTGLTPAAPTAGAITLAGTLVAVNGGTGQTGYAVGDLLYADTTTTLAKLADVATGNAVISGGVGVAPSWGKIGLTTHIVGVLPLANGGTNANLTAVNGGAVYSTGSALAITAAGTSGQVLTSNGAAAPTWQTPASGGVTTFSAGTTGLTPAAPTAGAVTLAGTLIAANGGTGQSSYVVGDLLYADTTTTLARLADSGLGNALITGGVGVAPSWGKIALTTHISGILGMGNGGSGANITPVAGGVIYTNAFWMGVTAAGTAGQALTSNGAAAPTWGTLGLTGGGTNASLTAVNGGAVYSTGSALAITAAGTAGQVLTSNGAAAPTWQTPGSISSAIPVGNMIWVDAAIGNDGTGLVARYDKPFATLNAAEAAANATPPTNSSWWLIVVRPGNYTIGLTMGISGIAWYFEPGSVITLNTNGWSMSNAQIYGYGNFIITGNYNLVVIGGGTNYIEIQEFTYPNVGYGALINVNGGAGTVTDVTIRKDIVTKTIILNHNSDPLTTLNLPAYVDISTATGGYIVNSVGGTVIVNATKILGANTGQVLFNLSDTTIYLNFDYISQGGIQFAGATTAWKAYIRGKYWDTYNNIFINTTIQANILIDVDTLVSGGSAVYVSVLSAAGSTLDLYCKTATSSRTNIYIDNVGAGAPTDVVTTFSGKFITTGAVMNDYGFSYVGGNTNYTPIFRDVTFVNKVFPTMIAFTAINVQAQSYIITNFNVAGITITTGTRTTYAALI